MNKVIAFLYGYFFKIWRPRRMQLFSEILSPSTDDVILDVGGYPDFWRESHIAVHRIDSLNIQFVPQPAPDQLPLVRTLVGDGCKMSFSDKSYKIAFSNSVIEHVGNYTMQQKFAAEICRVGERIWVQTPAFAFPLELHSLMPFLHWLPWAIRKRLLRITPVGLMLWWSGDTSEWLEMMSTTRILKKSEMHALFPDCTILTERLFWIIPKSYIAYRSVPREAVARR